MAAKAFRSPEVILMVVSGVAVAILGPYALYRISPHAPSVATKETPSGPRGVDLDVSELETLPDSLRGGAELLLTEEMPEPPDALQALPVATGPNVVWPVSEAVEETQPVLSWSVDFGAPPYTVSIADDRGMVIARAQGIQNTSWKVLMPLQRGHEYTWQVTVAGASEQASFRILDDGQMMLWRAMLAAHKESHLVIGLVAQQLGLLAAAEREYAELVKSYPESSTAALLLSNVQDLRSR